MSLELKNIRGNSADIYEKESGALICSWNFLSSPKLGAEQEFPLSKVIKLKEAGFDCDEIIKMLKEIK